VVFVSHIYIHLYYGPSSHCHFVKNWKAKMRYTPCLCVCPFCAARSGHNSGQCSSAGGKKGYKKLDDFIRYSVLAKGLRNFNY